MVTKVLGAAFCVLLAAPAFSQCVPASADIPFSFHVRDNEFAAGKYRIATIDLMRGTCGIVSVIGKSAAFFFVWNSSESAAAADDGALIFHRYGDTNFLSAVRNPGSSVSWKIAESKEEHATTTVSYPAVAVAITTHAR